MGIVIPNGAELNPEGLFLGQIIIPKKEHATRWDIGQIITVERLDLSVGPVLNVADLITDYRHQELPTYVDFLVSIEVPSDIKMLCIHQLVTPCLCDKEAFREWLIGRICGPVDSINGMEYFIMDVQTNEMHQVSIHNIDILMRRESSFSLEK